MQIAVGDRVKVTVTKITDFGVFVAVGTGSGMIHISQLSKSFVRDINDLVKLGDELEAVVLSVDEQGRIALSRKQLELEAKPEKHTAPETEEEKFEKMMSRFKTQSDERMHDLKKGIDAKRGSSPKRRK